jgi:methionine-rich copper-binding protein CopC
VSSEDIYFTDANPDPGETIEIFAQIHYYGLEPATDVEVTLYDILPINGVLVRLPIGSALVNFAHGGVGPVVVSAPWTATLAGAHVIKVVIEPPFAQPTHNDEATRLVTVGDAAALELTKQVALLVDADNNNSVSPGDTLAYTITFENNGDEVTGATLLDDYDQNWLLTPTGVSLGGVVHGGTITWDLGTLAAGANGTVTYQAQLVSAGEFPSGSTTVRNVALLTANGTPTLADSADVTVQGTNTNTPPTVGSIAPQTTAEGSPTSFTAAASDVDGNSLTYAWSIDNPLLCALNNANQPTVTITCSDNGLFQVGLAVDDGHGGQATTSTTLTVTNADPTISDVTITPDDTIEVNTPLALHALFQEPGSNDTHRVNIAWGDGSSCDSSLGTQCTVDQPNNLVTATHTYAQAGVYVVQLTVTDDDGGDAEGSYAYVVVWDPDAGYVTGNGTIQPPPTQVEAIDTNLKNKAGAFGFVSRYTNGVLGGKVQYRISHNGSVLFDFVSQDQNWLVIDREQAIFQGGTGKINGQLDANGGYYTFFITVIDGKFDGATIDATRPDYFRIQIKNSLGQIVYDNEQGRLMSERAITQLTSGKVVIHPTVQGATATQSRIVIGNPPAELLQALDAPLQSPAYELFLPALAE